LIGGLSRKPVPGYEKCVACGEKRKTPPKPTPIPTAYERAMERVAHIPAAEPRAPYVAPPELAFEAWWASTFGFNSYDGLEKECAIDAWDAAMQTAMRIIYAERFDCGECDNYDVSAEVCAEIARQTGVPEPEYDV
jgi:hypothetical protein